MSEKIYYGNVIRTHQGCQIDLMHPDSELRKSVWEEVFDSPFTAMKKIRELGFEFAVFVDDPYV